MAHATRRRPRTTSSAGTDSSRAHLALNRTPSFGYDPKSAGEIFQIEQLTYEYADFYFFGLNRDIGRNTKQLIEVARGADSDIQIAVARKMIAIIRGNAPSDFTWLCQRGPFTVSAATEQLGNFIMHDVFPDARAARSRYPVECVPSAYAN